VRRRARGVALAVVGLVVAGFGVQTASAGPPPGAAYGTSSNAFSSGGSVATAPAAGQAVKVAAFDSEPVVLQGSDFPGWTSGPEITARPPQTPTDYEVYNSQGSILSPLGLQSDCYQSGSNPDVNGAVDPNHGDHNCFQGSNSPVRTVLKGVPPQSLLGYRWDPSSASFVQIPFQVDTMWQHYLTNNASGFAFYSGADQMLTYTFDYEPFRFTSNPPFSAANPTGVCRPQPLAGQPDTTADPNRFLIDSDQLSFMARDAGPAAPASAPLPSGIVSANQVRLVDPQTGIVRYAYVMESSMTTYLLNGSSVSAPTVLPAYTAANSPYVHYDAFDPWTDQLTQYDGTDAYGVESTPVPDMYAFSQSNYSNYGNAHQGPVCNLVSPSLGAGGVVQPVVGQGFSSSAGTYALDPPSYVQRRSLDIAQVTTPRYAFLYGDPTPEATVDGQVVSEPLAGRWIMDGLSVSPDDSGFTTGDYGTSLVDRFKGRAFQQSPGGDTPCCGYEDEQVNWNGSSVTMGVKVGPVRDIRVTWGSDSGTNVTRTDIFYAYSINHEYNLRVHPIPPLDGIYTQWNMDAGAVTTYYDPENPKGVPVTGINPVLYGDTKDFVGPSGISESSNDTLGRDEKALNGGKPLTVGNPNPSACGEPLPVSIPAVGSPDDCVYGNFNVGDATFSGPSPLLGWEELTGPAGTTVDKWSIQPDADPSPGGAQAVAEAQPYYVDDSCFDDGTGSSPGPQVDPRNIDPTTWGFADVNGAPVAVSPAPASANRFAGTVSDDGTTYVTNASTSQAAAHPATMSTDDTFARRCWNHARDGTPYNIPRTATYDPGRPAQHPDPTPDPRFGPQGDVRYFEGDIGTHGLHLLFTSDTDNADLTTAVDEADSTDMEAVLPPEQPNVGSAYSAADNVPLLTAVTPFGSAPAAPQPDVSGPGLPQTAVSGPAGTGSSGSRKDGDTSLGAASASVPGASASPPASSSPSTPSSAGSVASPSPLEPLLGLSPVTATDERAGRTGLLSP
jgi:hypothetical protein